MPHRLVTRDFLRLFDVVSTRGINHQGIRELSGIRAWHDYDGYTCWLSFKDATVTLMFHGSLLVECDNSKTMDELYRLAHRLIAANSRTRGTS